LEGDITELSKKIGAVVAIDGGHSYVTEINLCFPQTIIDCLGREAGPVLDSAKALLLGCGHQLAVTHNAGGGVCVVSIDAEYDICRHFSEPLRAP
jgi:hypothetical protein